METIKGLTPSFRSLEKEIKETEQTYRKLKALQRFIDRYFPEEIKGQYSFESSLGITCPRVFIYLNNDKDSTIAMLKFIPVLKKMRFKVEKFWRSDRGSFAYKAEKSYSHPTTNYIIFFEHGFDLDGCVVTKKRKIQTVYVTDCETEKVL